MAASAREAVSANDAATRATEFDETAALRELLLVEERRRLDEIESRLAAYEHEWRDAERRARAHSEVLVDSLRLTAERGSDLSDALRPEVEQGLRRSIRDDPDVMADALYPVLGPAVRKLVASLFQSESSGDGQPYRVEQLFLIHGESGLVLGHAALDERLANDAEVVSGMLDAIRSFVQDAFATPDFDGMQTLQVGDITVWVEWGPQAVLAVVVRGFAPEALREACAETLRGIHLEHGTALEAFDGDTAPFETLGAELAVALRPVSRSEEDRGVDRRWFAAGALVAVLAGCVWLASSLSDQRRWERLLDRLGDTPGIVVVEAARADGVARLTAMRDPLADPPDAWMAAPALADLDVRARWVPYLSLDAAIVMRRVRVALAADAAAGLGDGATLEDGVLVLPGEASPERRATLLARLLPIPGVENVRFLPPEPSPPSRIGPDMDEVR